MEMPLLQDNKGISYFKVGKRGFNMIGQKCNDCCKLLIS
jgi:hypothetical protein